MKKFNPFPVPHMRFTRGSWEIYWYWNNKFYAFSPELYQLEAEAVASSYLHRIGHLLSTGTSDFPAEFMASAGVRRYLSDRFGSLTEDDLKRIGWKPTKIP